MSVLLSASGAPRRLEPLCRLTTLPGAGGIFGSSAVVAKEHGHAVGDEAVAGLWIDRGAIGGMDEVGVEDQRVELDDRQVEVWDVQDALVDLTLQGGGDDRVEAAWTVLLPGASEFGEAPPFVGDERAECERSSRVARLLCLSVATVVVVS